MKCSRSSVGWGLLGLAALLLPGCGAVSSAPSAGQLLEAPTRLNMTGKVLSADALPTLSGDLFSVKVKVQSSQKPLPALQVTDVYVVTSQGVWSAAVTSRSQWKCGPSCAVATGRGPAGDVQAGAGVQVVVGLRNPKGQTFLLRDAQAKVGK